MHNKEKNIYEGVITAMVTPYEKDEQGNLLIDYEVFGKLVKKQLIAGVNGIVVAGSTGEGTCLKIDQISKLLLKAKQVRSEYQGENRSSIVSSQIEHADEFAIICGLSSASTADALEVLQCINEADIDGVMLTSPHYVKPSRSGVRKHFEILASSTDLQIMLYSNKSRTGIEIDVEDVSYLSTKLPNIVAIKDAESDIIRPLRMHKNATESLSSNRKDNQIPFNILSGNDENYLAFYIHGGKGVVSVLSNIMPNSMTSLRSMLKEGNYEQARSLQCQLFDVYDVIYSDTNPSGVKYAASILGMCNAYVAMPLVELDDRTKRLIKDMIPKMQEIESGV